MSGMKYFPALQFSVLAPIAVVEAQTRMGRLELAAEVRWIAGGCTLNSFTHTCLGETSKKGKRRPREKDGRRGEKDGKVGEKSGGTIGFV